MHKPFIVTKVYGVHRKMGADLVISIPLYKHTCAQAYLGTSIKMAPPARSGKICMCVRISINQGSGVIWARIHHEELFPDLANCC